MPQRSRANSWKLGLRPRRELLKSCSRHSRMIADFDFRRPRASASSLPTSASGSLSEIVIIHVQHITTVSPWQYFSPLTLRSGGNGLDGAALGGPLALVFIEDFLAQAQM